MTYKEEESTKLRRQASKQAIALAMEGKWREAIAANETLIASFPNDVDAFNRLGRAHMELGEYARAKEAYEKALKVDPYNTIAQKNLSRLSHLKVAAAGQVAQEKVEPKQFIEEVGKAGVVNLRQLAQPQVLAKMVAGNKVNLKIDGTHLVVENAQGEYLGQVEPRHATRLVKLMNGGNKYAASIVSSAADAVTVIIRETYQHPGQVGQASFPSRGVEAAREGVDERIGDRMLRRSIENLEFEEALPGDTGYAIVDQEEGSDVEVLSEDLEDEEDDEDIDSGDE